jgi:hypothetical protein
MPYAKTRGKWLRNLVHDNLQLLHVDNRNLVHINMQFIMMLVLKSKVDLATKSWLMVLENQLILG